MKVLAYIAGPIHGSGTVEENVHKAMKTSDELRALGVRTYLPHLNTLGNMITPHSAEHWMDNDLEILSRCDVLLRLPGDSKGSDEEVAYCKSAGIPVFYSVYALYQWAIAQESKRK